MRDLPAGLQARLDSGATTLAWCWRLTRRDGIHLGFTDHDRSMTFDGTTFQAATGFTSSELATTIGLGVDSVEVSSALRSDSLDEDDLASGLFDDARVEIFRVDWQDTTLRVLVRAGSIGEVRRSGTAFTAEVRGLAHYLQQPRGRVYQRTCDAEFGDARCGIDISDPARRGTGTVASVADGRKLRVYGLSTFAAGLFGRGILAWTSGANAGLRGEIKRHDLSGETALIELWQEPARPVVALDAFAVTVGCDKTFATCRDSFANGINFRGFPHIPGTDYVTFYPSSGGPALTGNSQWNKHG